MTARSMTELTAVTAGTADHRSGYRTQKKKRSIFDVFDFD